MAFGVTVFMKGSTKILRNRDHRHDATDAEILIVNFGQEHHGTLADRAHGGHRPGEWQRQPPANFERQATSHRDASRPAHQYGVEGVFKGFRYNSCAGTGNACPFAFQPQEDGMHKPKVFVTRLIPAAGLEQVRAYCDADIWTNPLPPPADVLRRKVSDCEGLLSLLTERIDGALLD